MEKNNKKTIYALIIIVFILLLFILIILAWLFLSKNSFNSASNGNKIGVFKNSKADDNSIPSVLKWHDPFKEKEEEKSQGSYLHYLSEQNKNKN
jgi:flagellar basal body-associated protein FliL